MASHATAIRCRGVLGTSACARPVINPIRCQQTLVHAMAVSVAVSQHSCRTTTLPHTCRSKMIWHFCWYRFCRSAADSRACRANLEPNLEPSAPPSAAAALLSSLTSAMRLHRASAAGTEAGFRVTCACSAAQLPDKRNRDPAGQRCKHATAALDSKDGTPAHVLIQAINLRLHAPTSAVMAVPLVCCMGKVQLLQTLPTGQCVTESRRQHQCCQRKKVEKHSALRD